MTKSARTFSLRAITARLSALILVGIGPVAAAEIVVDCAKIDGVIRPLHGVNSGPIHAGEVLDLSDRHREIGVPLTRLHDCHWPNADVVDIHTLFPDPKADPSRPESYDFRRTDDYIRSIVDIGSGIVFRLGENIEHTKRKYHVHPPADPQRWAAVCAGVVRHYNEGWAEGFHYDIRYWEIWNEPENRPAMWTGNDEQFLDLYVTAARAIKRQSPGVLVGGPAFGYFGRMNGSQLEPTPFVLAFLARCKRDAAPLDFFSWHTYTNDPHELVRRARAVRRLLDEQGFTRSESHLNEWSLLPDNDWGPMMTKDCFARQRWFERQGGPEGATFAAAALVLLQDAPLDAANFYSADIHDFGLFNEHGVPKKTFYALKAFKMLHDTPLRITIEDRPTGGVAMAAGVARSKSAATILASNFGSASQRLQLRVKSLPWSGETQCEVLALDDRHDLTPIRTSTLSGHAFPLEPLEMPPFSIYVIALRPAKPAP
jgi:xylan 1,4-beta-xylosidase